MVYFHLQSGKSSKVFMVSVIGMLCIISGLLFPKISLVGGRLIITWNVAASLTYLQVYCICFGASLVPGYCIFTAPLLHPCWICMASWLLWQVEQTPGDVWFGAECMSTLGTHYTNGLWAHNPNFLYKKSEKKQHTGCSDVNSSDPFRSQFCTCHDSWAVVACVK